MQSYQILTLIGSILGILIILFAYSAIEILYTFGASIDENKDIYELYAQIAIGIIAYIVSLVIAFAIKNMRIVGIVLLVCSIIVIFAHGIFGIIGFVLLLPASIIALRQKKEKNLSLSDTTTDK